MQWTLAHLVRLEITTHESQSDLAILCRCWPCHPPQILWPLRLDTCASHVGPRNYSTKSPTFSNANGLLKSPRGSDNRISPRKTWGIRRRNFAPTFDRMNYSTESLTFSNAKWPASIFAFEITPSNATFSLGSIIEFAEEYSTHFRLYNSIRPKWARKLLHRCGIQRCAKKSSC